MNKKTYFVISSVFLGGATIFYLFISSHPKSEQSVAPMLTPPSSSQVSSTASIHGPVDVFGNFITVRGKSFTNTSTGATISFGNSVKDDGSRYGDVNVYVNGKEVGIAQVVLQSLLDFSADNRYFGFRTYYTYGAISFGHGLTVINVASSTKIEISSPHAKENPGNDVIESYSWQGDAVNVVSYLVTGEFSEDLRRLTYYRTTPKELWRYDLTTKQYTLLETLPE